MKVGIIMGSDSDLPVMKDAADFLESLKIPYEITIVSAHRTPQRLYDYAMSARNRGISVIIAGAGGSAHLPGMIASITTLPVVGVPIETKALGGVDSLYSIVQMPPGIPVATVGIDAAQNAGILAVQMLALDNPELKEKLAKFKAGLKDKIVKANIELKEVKYKFRVN